MKTLLLSCVLIVIATDCNHAYVIDLSTVQRVNAMPEEVREKAAIPARLETQRDGAAVPVLVDRLQLAKTTWIDSTSLRAPVTRPYGRFAVGAVALAVGVVLIGLASANQADKSCEMSPGYGEVGGLRCLDRFIKTGLIGGAAAIVTAVGVGFTVSAAWRWSPELQRP